VILAFLAGLRMLSSRRMAATASKEATITPASLWSRLDGAAQRKLEAYASLVMQYRSAARLTGVKTEAEAMGVLVLESLALLPLLTEGEGDIADLGSGAGVPGIPLAVALPDVHFTLYERSAKKADFLHIALGALGLENVEVDARDPLALSPQPKHRRLVTRAALPLVKLLIAAGQLLKPCGELCGFLSTEGMPAFNETLPADFVLLSLRKYEQDGRAGYVYRLKMEMTGE
jgi:16S rRNA (guanine527-N7)-methyltransferase